MDTASTVVRRSTVEYAPDLLLDLVRPAEAEHPLPAIVWIHGGGWRLQDRTACPDLVQHFAQHGYVMVSIDYRLAPGTCHPGQLFDVRRAVRWLRANAADHGIDPDRIGVWGSSAGGHLAALTGVHSGTTRLPGEEPATVDSSVQAVVDGYGPADLPGLVDLSAERTPGEDHSPEASLLGGAIRDRLDAARSASPALQVAPGAPPFLVMHGLGDNLVPFTQSVALYDALVAHGNDAVLYLIEGFGHGFFNPGHVLELGPDQTLDQGRLERDPQAPASTRAVSVVGRALTDRYPSASFAAVEAFFSHTLKPGTGTP
ncbi:alpha/beta hydrolase [Rhodococcus sp. JVH1]|uniref:alpha/beta hydrolase n=1 Tax=Rhodococcus sp. JVH1 TaxID=745408 RepID=UPI000271E077|nr:alpha/beta hydrolase [Rhodococcus sp. JVH1]EJI97440.1 alpha/beta hydrolase fold family protein [Rhodococcus sp. JVH1]